MDVTIKVEKLTIAQAQYAFRGGAYTAHDLTVAYLERIQRLDKSGPKIDATLAISQTTLQDATKLDQCLAKTVGLIGRLHGIPILTKDQADTASMERMYGSGACKGNVPTEDASLVKNVKAEGAVILGKTTMSEWATTVRHLSTSVSTSLSITRASPRRTYSVPERKSTAFLLQNHTCHKTSLRFCRSKRLKSSLGFTSQVAHGPLNPADDPDYLPLILDRVDFKRRLVYLLASMDLNALAFPDVQIPPPKHEDTTNGRLTSYWDFPVNTLLASQARLPAITVPAGFIEDGLSVGLELVGWEYHEQALLELAQGNELTIGARRSPPSLT
ncbi:hypothetical protein E4T46_06416 [Aureobasidium subglaciale]|nr:hypothetical protein E4T40_06616 [Aureobasidium subglaciale]KAI5260056.1 hypothetical protein E4T46_06416 [Aureobasidium subglaciale]